MRSEDVFVREGRLFQMTEREVMVTLFSGYGLFVRVETGEKLLMVSSLGRWRGKRPENRQSRECRNRPSQKLQPWLRLT